MGSFPLEAAKLRENYITCGISRSSLKHFSTVLYDRFGSLRNSSRIYKEPLVVCYSNCGHYTNVNETTLCSSFACRFGKWYWKKKKPVSSPTSFTCQSVSSDNRSTPAYISYTGPCERVTGTRYTKLIRCLCPTGEGNINR